jgi:hypothetical protein
MLLVGNELAGLGHAILGLKTRKIKDVGCKGNRLSGLGEGFCGRAKTIEDLAERPERDGWGRPSGSFASLRMTAETCNGKSNSLVAG